MANNPFLSSPFEVVAPEDVPVSLPKVEPYKPASTPQATAARGIGPSRDDIAARATELGVDPALALSFFSQESSGNWNSRNSPRGARGGMQVMPDTFKSMMGTYDGQDDPWRNMEAGLRYIAYGQRVLNTKDPQLLAAGYHAGYDRKDLKAGIIPNTNDGSITTKDYAAQVAARANGQDVPRGTRFVNTGTRTKAPVDPTQDPRFEVVDAADNPFAQAPEEASKYEPLNDTDTKAVEDAIKKQQQDIDSQSFTDRALKGGVTGFNNMVQSLETAKWALGGGSSEDLAKNLEQKFAQGEQRARSKTTGEKEIDAGFQAVTDAKGTWETTKAGAKAIGTFFANPKDAAVEVIEQAANSIPTMAGGIAGAGGGAAVGGVVGAVPGAIGGAMVGGRAGMVAGTTATELGGEIEDMVQKRLQDTKQPATAQNILAILNDKQFQSDARTQGLKKGLTVAAVDQLFMGIGGKIATAPVKRAAVRELADAGIDVSTSAARKQALASPAGKAALEAAKPSVASRAGAGAAAVGVDSVGETLGEGLSQKVARGEVDYGDALREGVSSVGQAVGHTAGGVAIEKGQQAVDAARSVIRPVPNAPSEKSGPLQRATENAANAPDRVTVTTPEGEVSGTVTGTSESGNVQIVGDDGQVHTFNIKDSGISVTTEKPAAPLSNALEGVVEDEVDKAPEAAAPEAPAPEAAAAEAAAAEAPAAVQTAAPVESVQPAAPREKPAKLDLTTMDEPALRSRLKYIVNQAKTNGGWNKMLSDERQRVEAEINKRVEAASTANEAAAAATPTVFNSIQEANAGMLDLATKTGQVHEVVPRADGTFELKPVTETTAEATSVAPSQPSMEAKATEAKLPRELAGAKPRYNYGNKAFELNFESDIDKAAYIAAQDKPSKRDAEYLAHAMQATGMSEAEVRAHGKAVREAIKQQAKDAKPGTLKVPTLSREQNAGSNLSAEQSVGEQGSEVAAGSSEAAPNPAPAGQSGVSDTGGNAGNADQPAKLKTASKEDVEHLFGTDKKREKALQRIKSGTAFFGTKDKAQDFIAKNGLKDTHEVEQTGKVRFEVKAKAAEETQASSKKPKQEAMPRQDFDSTAGVGKISAVKERYSDKFGVSWASTNIASADSMEEAAAIAKSVAESGADNIAAMREVAKNIQGASNGNDNSPAGQRNGAEKVEQAAGQESAEAASVQSDAAQAEVGAPLPNATAPEHVQTGVNDRELGQIVKEFNSAQKAMVEGDDKVTHVFDAPAKKDIVRLADKVKVHVNGKGWMTPAEAKAEIAKWKDAAQAQGKDQAIRSENSKKVVLSLFDLSGEWSKPWEEAGYQVYRFDIQADPDMGDVNNFSTEFFGDWFGDFDGQDIYAILAACPCTDFASSGARHFAAKDKDGRTVSSVKLVHQTLATIEYFKPAVWAVENPVGRIEELGGLPPWRLSFDPNHLGDPYTKKTLIWGRFNGELPVAPVEPTEGSKMHRMYGGKSLATKNARSVTPEGFSYGFFMANNAHDHQAMAVANKFDRLDRNLIEQAIDAGVTPDAIESAVEDFYFMDLDDAAANEAIRDLIPTGETPNKAPAPTEPAAQQIKTTPPPTEKMMQPDWWTALTPNERYRRLQASGISGTAQTPWNRLNAADQRALDEQWGGRQAEQAKPAVSENKVFTEDAAERARKLLKQRLSGSQLNSGVDPEIMQAGIVLAGYHIEKGARTFSAYAKAMIADLGDVVKPYLKSWYMGVKYDPRATSFEGMDTAADVESADVNALTAEPATENENEPQKLDQPGAGALEGAQTDLLSGTEPQRQTRGGAEGRGRADASGNERAGGGRVQQSGSVGDDTSDVSVPAGRAGKGRGGEQGRSTVQRGKRTAKQDPTVESGGNDLLTPTEGQRAQDRGSDFQITADDEIGEGGAKTKFRNNMAAIRLLKQLQTENRPATRAEQAVLAKYVGWGGLPQAFFRDNDEVTKGWEKEAAELKATLTEDELAAAASSTRNAHYTSPEIVQGMWDAVKHFGFQGGRVLEPSVGVGNFFGLMPSDLRSISALNGVELDHITGGIAQKLYPQAKVAAPLGFQDYSAPDNYFDLAIGNPPFGREGIYDANRRSISGFSIHNYFFAKSIDTVRPNGVLAMVVTNRLLDSAGDKARQYIADRAEFLGAIRLPNNAFLKNAGTEVTTDIIFLRKLKDGERPTGQSWMNVRSITDKAGKDVPLNEYFVRNPDMMLGEFGAFGSMYSPDEPALIAREGQDTAALLKDAIKKLPSGFMDAPTAEPTRETITPSRDISAVKIGSVFEQDGQIYERRENMLTEQQAAPVTFPNDKAKERVSGMIRVRDALTAVRSLQLSDSASDAQIEAARAELNTQYDAFVKANGPINSDANKRLMRDDPSWPQIAALEDNFDKGISAAVAKTTGEQPRAASAKKAAIFSKRTQSPYQAPQKASTAKDAMVTSLAELGRVDLDYMAKLYGKPADAIFKELEGLVYRNPRGGVEARDQYLSGNVKKKLAEAIEAAKTDKAFEANVDALRAVQPADIEAVDIDVKVGAHWVPTDVMEGFVRSITEAGGVKAIYNPVNAQWTITTDRVPSSAQTQWGTDRALAKDIIQSAANQKQMQIYDQHHDGTRTLNEAATTAANEKIERVKAEWKRWVWEDDARRERLSRIYNDTFNTDVQREFDGSHLTFPGKVGNDIVHLRPHQANAIWRIVQSGTTLLDHVVGAGKTFTMIGGIMELRRMGLAKKPVLVVPNHLVGQWAEDFIKLYPGANILAATKKDFEKDRRKKLFARIATGDWDAVIVAHSSFGKVEVEPEFQQEFIKQQIADMDTSISAMRAAEGKGSRNVKQIEKQKAALEEKLKRLFDTGSKDDNLYFSELGIDAVLVDEAHEFKNLGFSTGMQRVAGLGNPTGSNKAADLFMKVRSILKRTNGRNVVFATGTPISNTMAEMYTMQRYLDYDTLKAQGIAHFDAWGKTFGEVVTDWELSPSGQYKMNSRFAKFVNMPELMQRYQSFADVVNRDDINRMLAVQGKKLPVPKIKGGKPENVVVPRSQDQAAYIGIPKTDENGNETYPQGSLIWRSENLPKKAEKGADNMLKIMSDARKAALDMRMIDPSYPDNPDSKVNVAAGNIVDIYHQWSKDKGTQLVFIDLSTPKGAAAKESARLQELIRQAEDGDEAAQEALSAMSPDELLALESGKFSVYDDLKDKLIARGIPENEIAFIHDANTEQQKEDLFGKVRSGRIRVLFGSTAKMGAGMNVQERLVALHHLDAPWRPSDLEQREGRIIRQGNKLYEADPDNFEVQIQRYATKQTLDSRMWQTIEAKARFIEQVRKGAGSREVEDVAGEAANSAEMKAASSGNPLILEEMTLRQQIRKLENQQAEHAREQHRIKDRMRLLGDMANSKDAKAEIVAKDARLVPPEFKVTIGKQTFEKHGEAGEAILAAVDAMHKAKEDERSIGSYGGFSLSLAEVGRFGGKSETMLLVKGADEYQVEANAGSNATGLALRLQNTVKGLTDEAENLRKSAASARADIPKLESQIKPWTQDKELADAKSRHAAVIDQLRPKKKEQPAAQNGETDSGVRMSRGGGMEAIFAGLEGNKQERAAAQQELAAHPNADMMQYVEDNFWNILGQLEDSNKVDIKC